MKENKFFIVKIIFISLIVFNFENLFSQSILNKNFSNYFEKNIFVKFPNWKNGFVFENAQNQTLQNEILSLENSDEYEIKFSYLPRIPVSQEIITDNSIYKYQQDLQMRLFKSEDSHISMYQDPLGQTTRVFKEDNLIKNKKYDEKDRIFDEKIWKFENNSYTLLSEKKYFYNSPEDKFYNSTELLNYEKNLKMIENFNEVNLLKEKNVFSITKDKNKKNIFELLFVEKYFYDSENRILEFITEKNNSVVKIKYLYDKNFKSPDEIVFEDDIKKSEKIFSSDFDYSYTVFLDENYSIKTLYNNSFKVDESIYLNGEKIRTSKGVVYE